MSWYESDEKLAEATTYLATMDFEPRAGRGVWMAEIADLGTFKVSKSEGMASRPWTLECWLVHDGSGAADLYYVKATGSDCTAFVGLLGALGVSP